MRGGAGAPVEVATVTLEPERLVLSTELPGRTAPYLIAEIRPQVSGLIQKRLFTEGADVKAGEVLYEIDPSSYQAAHDHAKAAVAAAKASHATAVAGVAAAKANHATALAARDAARTALASAQANLARAEANVTPLRLREERFRELVASKAVSQQDLDDVAAARKEAEAGVASTRAAVAGAEAEIVRAEAVIQVTEAGIQSAEAAVQGAEASIQSSEAALEAARINLGYTRITAPISGRIGRSAVTTGALVTAHQPLALATLQQLDPI
ncbi:MAG: biotin/lipoyl-binding protein, partial [Planctomycetes bacterium]|nr:biotin/lipoyl-binding protein [Planctomycetota bacterium]